MGLGIDSWPRIVRNHGYAPAFLAKIRKRARRPASEGETDALPVFELDEFRRFRERNVPEWAVSIARAVCAAHGVSVAAVAGKVRSEKTDKARRAAIYAIKEARQDTSSTTLGKWFDRHHTTILFSLAVHQRETGAPPLTTYSGKNVEKPRAA